MVSYESTWSQGLSCSLSVFVVQAACSSQECVLSGVLSTLSGQPESGGVSLVRCENNRTALFSATGTTISSDPAFVYLL